MTIREIRDLRKDLEDSIEELVREFHQKSPVMVEDIRFIKYRFTSIDEEACRFAKIQVKLKRI